MDVQTYDAVVVGSGEAGKYLAWHLARSGQKVVVVERAMVGGACPNVACLPSKNVIHSAKVVDLVRHAAAFGAQVTDWHVDLQAVRLRKQTMIDGLIQMHHEKFAESGAELLMGEAQFVGPRRLLVRLRDGGETILESKRIFLNTGSRASMPEIPGLAEARPMTHVEALELQTLPSQLLVLGGGYVGLELAQAYRRLGCTVTVLHRGPRLLPQEDDDVSEAMLTLLHEEGIEVLLQADVTAVSGRSGESVMLTLASGERLHGSHVLVATGRRANTEALHLEAGGVQVDGTGYIQVDETLRTTADGVWAMGDCAGSPHFTHVAYDDFRVVRDTLAGKQRSTKDRLIPFSLFTDPELARVGLNEAEAAKRGIRYRLARLPMVAVLRTRTLGETRGFLKALVGDDDRILGFTAFGVGAGEMVAVVQMVMLTGAPYTLLADAIVAHPTLAEGLMYLFSSVPHR